MSDEQENIFIVDDRKENLLAFSAVLEGLGNVITAKSGKEALSLVDNTCFAVILLDVMT